MPKILCILMSQHGSRKTDFFQGSRLGVGGHIVEWPKAARPDWMSQEDYQNYPAKLRLREVKVDDRILVTSLLDPKKSLHASWIHSIDCAGTSKWTGARSR